MLNYQLNIKKMKKLLKSLGYTDLKSIIIVLWWTIAMIALTAECNEILTLFNIINFGIATYVVCRYVEIPNDDSNEI